MNTSDQKSLPAHTAGPWGVNDHETDRPFSIGHRDQEGKHHFLAHPELTNPNLWNDVFLMRAAPELLAALKNALEILDDQLTPDTLAYLSDSVQKMKAAIQSAEGGTP